MWQLQFHVSEELQLGVNATSAFSAHRLKNDSKLPSESEIRGVGMLRARKPGRVFWKKRSM